MVILIVYNNRSLSNDTGMTGPGGASGNTGSMGAHISFVQPHAPATAGTHDTGLSERTGLASDHTGEVEEKQEV
jgi:hypothetical protein